MSDSVSDGFTVVLKVQLSGILLKKSFSQYGSKWAKKFCIVKESFLLYYSENEKKNFDRKGVFNIHPKGCIPLGGCVVQAASGSNHDYIIQITSDNFVNGSVVLAAETKYDQERWITALQEAARITCDNSRMGESIIRDLECRGLQLNKEKQNYVDKLHEETIALREEIDKNEELGRLNNALDQERNRLEVMIKDFREQQLEMKEQYEETMKAMKIVEEDKRALQDSTEVLMKNLADLEAEKKEIVVTLHRSENAAQHLQTKLQNIEREKQNLMEEKEEIDGRYQQNELRARVLEKEKYIITQQSSDILSSIKDLQSVAENDLRIEVSARLEAEHRLKLAQDSMYNLEGALETNDEAQELKIKILPDVKKLRRFFEEIAEEARIDANMPVIMKNAVYARKSLVKKACSQRLENCRKENALSLGLDLTPFLETPALKRSLSVMIAKNSLKPKFHRAIHSKLPNGEVGDGNSICDNKYE